MVSKNIWVISGFAILFLLVLSFPVSSKLEERDTFCIACHTIPEETYYQRAQDARNDFATAPIDLSSAHYRDIENSFRCIDCHRGDQSLSHKWQTFLLGGKDTLLYISGQADPTIEKLHAGSPVLLNAGCLSCHADALLELGFNNHYHNQLLAAGELAAEGLVPVEPQGGLSGTLFAALAELESSVTCTDCHQAHLTIPDGDLTLYLDVEGVLFPTCVQCHKEVGKGPLELQ